MTRKKKTMCIERDYWRISLADSLITGDPQSLMLQGRRRITEAFWPAFELPIAEFERLLESVGNAVVLAEGYRWTGSFAAPPSFPNTDTLALCQGRFTCWIYPNRWGATYRPRS